MRKAQAQASNPAVRVVRPMGAPDPDEEDGRSAHIKRKPKPLGPPHPLEVAMSVPPRLGNQEEPVRAVRGTQIYRGFDAKPRNGRDTDYPWREIEVGEQFFLREGGSRSGASRASRLLAPKKFSIKSDVVNPATGKPATLITRVK